MGGGRQQVIGTWEPWVGWAGNLGLDVHIWESVCNGRKK